MLQLQSKKENFDTQPVAGGSLFATLEVLDGEVVVAAKLKTVSTSWRTDNGKAHARLKEVVVGNVVIKNAAYITLNQNKHSKDANKATQVTGVINLVGVIPTVARQSTTVVAHSSCARNGMGATENFSWGLKVRRSRDFRVSHRSILVELDQNNSKQLQVASVREFPDPEDPSRLMAWWFTPSMKRT
ncbi:hypothetical protein V6N11_083960 [Hibiscus sabdariffa]|uniref:Uncharacterized protein n=1 Tax=Hibiscus sabdariffa TaxID=183260 RepID=A0ABR2QD32_9ROSI